MVRSRISSRSRGQGTVQVRALAAGDWTLDLDTENDVYVAYGATPLSRRAWTSPAGGSHFSVRARSSSASGARKTVDLPFGAQAALLRGAGR